MLTIGYDFLGSPPSMYFDTAIPTSQLDDIVLYEGIYDELYISLDTAISRVNERPTGWFLKNIMHSKFKGNLESGSLDADGHEVTKIQIYRRVYGDGSDEFTLVGEFKYSNDYNTYSFIDITAKNDTYYEYAIVPVASDVIGEKNISDPVYVEYKGVFISDLHKNYKLQFNYDAGETSHNKNFATFNPLNGEFPVVVYGNQDYKTGSIEFLPLSETQIKAKGTKINSKEERVLRDSVTSFLNDGSAKVLRDDNGEIMILAVDSVKSRPISSAVPDIQSVSFNYTELGRVDSSTLVSTGLVGDVVRSNYTYDAFGNVIWDLTS